jgi:hypothetical protein
MQHAFTHASIRAHSCNTSNHAVHTLQSVSSHKTQLSHDMCFVTRKVCTAGHLTPHVQRSLLLRACDGQLTVWEFCSHCVRCAGVARCPASSVCVCVEQCRHTLDSFAVVYRNPNASALAPDISMRQGFHMSCIRPESAHSSSGELKPVRH